ncbi:hypothetical protein ACHAPJ_009720 [Fusarium lateritium]
MSLWKYQFKAQYSMEDLSRLRAPDDLDFRNKTVPIYLLIGEAGRYGLTSLLQMVLHNYLYKKWFRPFRSDIEQGQFVAKVLKVNGQSDTKDEASAIDLAMRMHTAINNRLDSLEAKDFYITRPLFRAVAIVVPGQNYSTCGVISHLATMPVLVILSGENEGLSPPISFDRIASKAELITVGGKVGVRTDLETAIDFIMFLEHRQDSVFGPQPDPVAALTSTGKRGEQLYEYERIKAKLLGMDGEFPLSPSSQWVDTGIYQDWTGSGAHDDAVVMRNYWERSMWRHHAQTCTCGVLAREQQ